MKAGRGQDMPDETTAANAAGEAAGDAATDENRAMDGSRGYTEEEFEAEVQRRVDAAVKDRVSRAKAKAGKQIDGLSAEKDELAERVRALETQLAEEKATNDMRAWADEISAEMGVPADVLRGSTREEMQSHAESLRAHFDKPSAPYVASDGFASNQLRDESGDWLRSVINAN